ncbi:HD domain-containing protein [Sedimentibacter sp. zth1]|nr:HD domain-containing protein [Sedimentibacter sp. zth1]
MMTTKEYCQHGNTSCYLHSISVAYYSLRLANVLRLNYDLESLIKGALLHDYFLYDWHKKSKNHRLHGFSHPVVALKNAKKEYVLNDIETDIIIKHMFPLTILPPIYKESILVCLVDKICSIKEVFYFGLQKIYHIELKINLYTTI